MFEAKSSWFFIYLDDIEASDVSKMLVDVVVAVDRKGDEWMNKDESLSAAFID